MWLTCFRLHLTCFRLHITLRDWGYGVKVRNMRSWQKVVHFLLSIYYDLHAQMLEAVHRSRHWASSLFALDLTSCVQCLSWLHIDYPRRVKIKISFHLESMTRYHDFLTLCSSLFVLSDGFSKELLGSVNHLWDPSALLQVWVIVWGLSGPYKTVRSSSNMSMDLRDTLSSHLPGKHSHAESEV